MSVQLYAQLLSNISSIELELKMHCYTCLRPCSNTSISKASLLQLPVYQLDVLQLAAVVIIVIINRKV